jgi:hypothetical protein
MAWSCQSPVEKLQGYCKVRCRVIASQAKQSPSPRRDCFGSKSEPRNDKSALSTNFAKAMDKLGVLPIDNSDAGDIIHRKMIGFDPEEIYVHVLCRAPNGRRRHRGSSR